MPYVVNHSGQTEVGEENRKVKYKKGEPVKDVKKGELDHVKGAEWVTSKELESKEGEDEKKSEKE